MIIQRPNIPTHPTKPYPTRQRSAITHIIVHHSLTKSGSAAAYARFHIKKYGWPGIAYHFVIDTDGAVNGTLDINKIGYHCKGMNTASIGIVLTGNFDKTVPALEQIESLARLVVMLQNGFVHHLKLAQHSDYSSKTCPGANFPWLGLVARVASLKYAQAPRRQPSDTALVVSPDELEPAIVMPSTPDADGANYSGCMPAFLLSLSEILNL